MSNFYQEVDASGGFDYSLYELEGRAGTGLRGPPVDPTRPFIAFVGAAQTFGRFAHRPFPSILGDLLGLQVLNLGVGAAGPRHFLRNDYLDLLNQAELVVFQILSGRSASSSLFDNRAKGGMKGMTPFSTEPLDVDDFYRLLAKRHGGEAVFRSIVEMRDDYLASFRELLTRVMPPKVLFWLSTRPPAYVENYQHIPFGVYSAFPHLINGPIVEALKPSCDAYVECISSKGLPQPLWPGRQSMKGAVAKDGMLENRYYPSPEIHAEAANRLADTCRRFSGRAARGSDGRNARFVVIGAERTGTNLLIGMLNQFSEIFCGGELFNSAQIGKGRLDWRDVGEDDRAVLLALRDSDPAAFWQRLTTVHAPAAKRVVGFKLLYKHGLTHTALTDAVASDGAVRIVHLVRRNQLKRFLSERQARAIGRWAAGMHEPEIEIPAVPLNPIELVKSFGQVEEQRLYFEDRFAAHSSMVVIYEDFASRPPVVARRVAHFLGVDEPGIDLAPTYRKTGIRPLQQSIDRFDALKAQFEKWAMYFSAPGQSE